MQRIRDEAHRFAIATHRAKRSKELVKSRLDEIGGIGGVRKKALLNHFGSSKAVEQASIKDLLKVDGISQKTAEIIYNYFH
jgi:excinuclease ABC subunit C